MIGFNWMRLAMRPDSHLAAAAQSPLDFARPRFDASSESLLKWIGSLREAGVRQAGPALILALESLRRADISPSRRFAVLRLLKAPLLKTCAGLPKPRDSMGGLPVAGAEAHARGVTVEQRLYRLMFQNLNQALRQLDRCYFMLDSRQARRRAWAVRNLFRFFDRQIRYATLWGYPLPEGAWRDLHELYVYLMVGRQPDAAGSAAEAAQRRIDPEQEYKRTLLFGLVADASPAAARSGALLEGLGHWAHQTHLEDPQTLRGEVGALVVKLADDTPPRAHPGPLSEEVCGWVLQPPQGLMEHLDRTIRGDEGTLMSQAQPRRPLPGMR